MQVAIVQTGGLAFGTVPLEPRLWLYSAMPGAAGWALRQALLAVPTRRFDAELSDSVETR